MRSSLGAVTGLVLARECAGCGEPGTSWCVVCDASLAGAPGRQTVRAPWGTGVPGPASLVVWSGADYADPVRAAVVAWKDRGRTDLTPILAGSLRRVVTAALDGRGDRAGPPGAGRSVLLVPAPSSRGSRRDRGREPVRDLARRCAAGLRRRGVDVRVRPVLAQGRAVRDQAGLGVADRSANLAGALWVPGGWVRHLAGRDCVVVDDVVTTGATLLECVRALTAVGASVRAAATVAATRRRITRSA